MAPQRVMTRKKGRGNKSSRGAGSRRGGASARAKDSATSAADITGPTRKLTLKFTNKFGEQDTQNKPKGDFGYSYEQQAEEEEADNKLPVANTTSLRTSSGRVVKKPHDEAHIYSSEMDAQIELQAVKKADRESSGSNFQGRSSPPIFIQRDEPTPPHQRPSRPRKNSKTWPSLVTIHENNNILSSDMIQPSLADTEERRASSLNISEEVLQTMKMLCGKAKVFIDLPTLVDASSYNATKRYSATHLMQLYIEANKRGQWNLCDLIADTWIRAFHALRRRGEKSGKEEDMLWRPNKSLIAKHMQGLKGYDTKAPDYSRVLRVEDPELEPDVTDFNTKLLDALYSCTPEGCGARTLWADAMALSGKKLENRMQSMKRRKEEWHPDLLFEVLCTSLRISRRKLTLKIEESTEGAWCKRYHEHSRHGKPCYRKLAYARRWDGFDDTSDEDEVDAMAQGVEAEMGGKDRQAGGDDMEMGYASLTDEDAEGESDDQQA
ncbi:hypothetical protein BDU57DRAFT_579126 [Ampelomyces quisqualis]|uniref:Uncharacterized protein n=1 Tax=Ampelomyces quisqualis TaxID=50730 RepID=A0A6A5QJ30_AMPQU|nr:hypothetical protein BDU57DRAFT_579126 [Ampelomyces quisqualis]